MVTVGRKLTEPAKCGNREHVSRRGRVLNGAAAIACGGDTGDPQARDARQLLLEKLGNLIRAQAEIHDIHLLLDAVFERIDQLTDLPTGEDLAYVDFSCRSEAHDAGFLVPAAGNDTGAMRSVRERVHHPAVRSAPASENIESIRDGSQVLVGRRSAGVDDRDPDALAAALGRYLRQLVEPHRLLSPSHERVIRKIWKAVTQRPQRDDIRLGRIQERRALVEAPVVALRSHVESANRLRRVGEQ